MFEDVELGLEDVGTIVVDGDSERDCLVLAKGLWGIVVLAEGCWGALLEVVGGVVP
ncbi:hypothetical protein [Endozoicomonas sp. ALB091]|uniref:hypothetical protein n=1 Tax=Endozoicomonas sp. ALB091 TaxID=3403073 RepID=UPI003BB5C1F8